MPELCYTANQIRFVKASIVAMMSISIFQAMTSRALLKDLARVKRRYNNLHDASMYLFEIIEKNGVDLTEFDEIAIHALVNNVVGEEP